MPRDAAPGLTLAWGVIPSGSNPIESRQCSGWSHRPGVRLWYAFDRAGSVGGRVKSHRSRSGVRPQCDLMPKAPSKTRDFDWKGMLETDYLGELLMHFGERHGTRRPRARCWLRPHDRNSFRVWVGRWQSG